MDPVNPYQVNLVIASVLLIGTLVVLTNVVIPDWGMPVFLVTTVLCSMLVDMVGENK
jgi:hypothetical protein